ncbi:phospholipid hydroperoxide glutathione peroxidase 1, chloroplastic-like isoform X2 [Papaver somniferum]|uniref:phospholipid hydroperoxide glutathione peroxidase 1, chloroplastic-like isoform X2 n=1 Tax=Papaver somniferum TaxID=3469 RepID=UPI000E6F7D3F|nr:phospholipid hydroperoxide glutathione peroxidase 1, chloroplastic-like isoform X2 [Papaver somniferum]
MASMGFCASIPYSQNSFTRNLVNPSSSPIPCFGISDEISSKSSFVHHGFSLISCGFQSKSIKTTAVVYARAATEKSIYDFSVKDIDGKDVSLSKFKGKTLLVVNVASRCGLTTSNYTELSHIYEKYKTQGLEILAFPCNQFGFQEPGSNTEIKQFACTRFKAEFPIFDKMPNARLMLMGHLQLQFISF